MKIAVYGAGGVGGYYGAVLARAGHEVTLIARGPHLAAIRQRGLRVRSPRGDFTVNPAAATDDPARIGVVDAVGTSSLQRDLAAGVPAELDDWSGAAVWLGARAGVETPVQSFVYSVLLPGELAARRRG